MAITAMGLGTKAAPEGANLDPQRQFWSWLTPFVHPDEASADSGHHQRGYLSGFACTQTEPAGMTIQIGGGSNADSALLVLSEGKCVLLSTDGEPEVVTIPTAPASGSRIDTVVSYIDTTSADPEAETPGTPEYVHTIVVSGTAASSPSAPTDAQIVSALPAGANSKYYRWCDVKVAQSQTVITNSNITDRKPTSPNVYWTTSEIEQIADSQIKDSVPGMIVARAPYVASVSVNASAISTPSITAPAAKSGFKFLIWVMCATSGFVGSFYPENPTSRTTTCYGVVNGGGSGKLNCYALYVPIS